MGDGVSATEASRKTKAARCIQARLFRLWREDESGGTTFGFLPATRFVPFQHLAIQRVHRGTASSDTFCLCSLKLDIFLIT
jgi:hypothetical protein